MQDGSCHFTHTVCALTRSAEGEEAWFSEEDSGAELQGPGRDDGEIARIARPLPTREPVEEMNRLLTAPA